MNEVIESILTDPLLETYILSLTWTNVAIAEGLAVLFLAMALVYNLFVHFLRTKGRELLEYAETARILVIIFMIPFYVPLLSVPVTIIDVVNDFTKPTTGELADYAAVLGENVYENGFISQLAREFSVTPEVKEEVLDENPTADTGTETLDFWDFLGSSLNPSSLGMFLLDMVTVSLASIIRFVIQALLSILTKVFFVLGPFALVVSILPIWKDKMVVWFNTFITIYFTYVVFNIFDKILYANLIKDLVGSASFGEMGTSSYQSLVLNLVMLVLYFMPFWVSGKIVGSSDAGRFLALTSQIATTAVTGAMGGVAKAMGPVSGLGVGKAMKDKIGGGNG